MTQGHRAQAGVFEAGLLTVPGVEALREIHAGRFPQPPIHHWSGRKLTALQHGEASTASAATAVQVVHSSHRGPPLRPPLGCYGARR